LYSTVIVRVCGWYSVWWDGLFPMYAVSGRRQPPGDARSGDPPFLTTQVERVCWCMNLNHLYALWGNLVWVGLVPLYAESGRDREAASLGSGYSAGSVMMHA
jgi:hypothetical protein